MQNRVRMPVRRLFPIVPRMCADVVESGRIGAAGDGTKTDAVLETGGF